MPPSRKASGGSSMIACAMSATTSGISWSCSASCASSGCSSTSSNSNTLECESASSISRRNEGNCSMARRKFNRSRAFPVPTERRVIVRSRSRTSRRCFSNCSRRFPSSVHVCTACCLALILPISERGCVSQSRRRRAPMGVRVWFTELYRHAALGASRVRGSRISRLRREVPSIVRNSVF